MLVVMMYHKYNSDDISYNAMIYHSPVLGTRATKIFLSLLNSLGLSSGLSANGLENLGGDVLAHALGDTLGHVGGHILEDGSSGDTVLGGHLGGGVGDVGGGEEQLGIGLGLPLAKGVHGGDDVLDVSAGGLLVAGDVPAHHDGLGGAVGLGVAPLADGDGLGDDLADGDHVVDEGGGVGEPVSKKELGVGVGVGSGGREGSGGQEGETEGNLGRMVSELDKVHLFYLVAVSMSFIRTEQNFQKSKRRRKTYIR